MSASGADPIVVHPMRPAPPPRYRVVKDKVISFHGAMTRISAGTIVSAASYGGDEGMRGILAQLGPGGARLLPSEG